MLGRTTILCIEYDLTEEEALRELLQRHLGSDRLNDFCLILLALELEPFLKEKARANQQVGGQNKGSSNLTEAGRLDVRKEIARIIGVSVGNVTKVKQLIPTAAPDIINALRGKEISIHRAWVWSKLSPEGQREELWQYRAKRGIRKTIRDLVSQYRSKSSPTMPDMGDLLKLLSAVQSGKLGPIRVVSINVPGNFVFVSDELLRAVGTQKELALV